MSNKGKHRRTKMKGPKRDYITEAASILALALCDIVESCDTCYFIATKQMDDLVNHPLDVKDLIKYLKRTAKGVNVNE
jgi:hypothetical protein